MEPAMRLRPPLRDRVLLFLLAALPAACGSGHRGGNGGGGTPVLDVLVAVSPPALATDVSTATPLEVIFREPLDPQSIEPSALGADDGYGAVPGSVRYDPSIAKL